MEKIIFNPRWNEMNTKAFMEQIEANEGYCPCKAGKLEENRCICKEFRDMKHDGFCYCELYYKIMPKKEN